MRTFKLIYCVMALLIIPICGISQVSEKYQDNLIDYHMVSMDINAFKQIVKDAPLKGSLQHNRSSTIVIDLPMPDRTTQQFRVVEAPILSPELSSQRPGFKSYLAQGVDDPTAVARFNITPSGLYAIIRGINGISQIELIDKSGDSDQYITYYEHHIINKSGNGLCQTEQGITDLGPTILPRSILTNSCFQNGENLRTYELVLTCTGEFYQLNGNNNTDVETALLDRITQLNCVYEVELAITFTIEEYLLNADPTTDPFTNPSNLGTTVDQVAAYIDANVTASSWDLGHGFHEITCPAEPDPCDWGGVAPGSVCNSDDIIKAKGYTFLPNNRPMEITTMVHEFGHMFGAWHTRYGCSSSGTCGRYEPGAGSTIMSTAANCDPDEFYADRSDYFNVASLQQVLDYASSGTKLNHDETCTSGTEAGWSECSDISATGNNMPTADADANNINSLNIPKETPFILNGAGSDDDGLESLTFCWEQYNTNYTGSDAPDDTGMSTTAPQFRSFPPTASSERICPKLESVLAGNVTTGTGEILPQTARFLTWRLVVRDNEAGGGGIACDEIVLNVTNDGPFRISSQNNDPEWNPGSTQTVTWDVSNTDNVNYNCANIDILYSDDGGFTFDPTPLASNVPNNGSATITAPAALTSTGRLKIICTGSTNIFFDINDTDITITDMPLSAELTYFDGKRLDEAVQLNWETATEINNEYFTLARSSDGSKFETIATINGVGTSFENVYYQFIDEKPLPGINYYRLSQTDYDGTKVTHEKIVVVTFTSETYAQIRPNPVAADQFQLTYHASQTGDLALEIYSVTGALVFQGLFEVHKENNDIDLSVPDLSKGVYIVRTRQKNVIRNLRFVKS